MPNLEMVYDVKNLGNSKGADAVKNSVSALQGVNNVKVDFDGNKVIVGYTPGIISVQAIKKTIIDQGYEVI